MLGRHCLTRVCFLSITKRYYLSHWTLTSFKGDCVFFRVNSLLLLSLAGNTRWQIPHLFKTSIFFRFKRPFFVPPGYLLTLKNHPNLMHTLVLKEVLELCLLISSKKPLLNQTPALSIYTFLASIMV